MNRRRHMIRQSGPGAWALQGRRPRACRFFIATVCVLPVTVLIAIALPVAATEPTAAADNSTEATSPQRDLIAFLVAAGEDALAHERYGEAQERFAAALRLDWNQPRAFALLQQTRTARESALRRWENEARSAEARRDYSGAAALYGKVMAEDLTRHELATALARVQRRGRAAQFVRHGLEKFIADDFSGAQLDFEQALAICPDDTVAAGYRHRAMQNVVQSAGLAELRADSVAWTKYLDALQRFRDGDLASAEQLWNDVLAKYPGNAQVRSNLEQIRRRLDADRVAATE
ncbi:MAG: hypothetical protein AB1792_09125 [Candidatus Zixiibacteriota bacterium]